MNNYFGFFSELKKLYDGKIKECGLYDDIFSNVYNALAGNTEIKELYAENGFYVGKNVLEIAAGDGSNYMIPLAQKGFNVDGVEISESMIARFNENVSKLPQRIKKRLNIIQADIFEYETDKKYDLITIPSTTICLLSDDEDRLKRLFDKIYSWLTPNGRLMFDYRTDQVTETVYASNILTNINLEEKYYFVFQEFNNFIPEKAVVNMYVETADGTKYLASSEKKIITDDFIESVIGKTSFKMHHAYDVNEGEITMKVCVYKKEEAA